MHNAFHQFYRVRVWSARLLVTILFCGFLGIQIQSYAFNGPIQWSSESLNQDSSILGQLPNSREGEFLVVFTDQFDAASATLLFESQGIPLAQRQSTVIQGCMSKSSNACALARQWLDKYNSINGTNWSMLDSFWIVNAVIMRIDREAATALIQKLDVRSIDPVDALPIGYTESLSEPKSKAHAGYNDSDPASDGDGQPEIVNGREPGLTAIQAPLMWARGYTGKNRRAMLMDTGVWPEHPAIRGKFIGQRMGLDQSWYAYDEPVPADKIGNHGTHVIGTVLGLDSANRDTIGVAFGAYFIATDPIVTNLALVRSWTQLMRAYQWALNPDGDTSTHTDIPDVINNSWGRANAGFDSVCQATVVAQALQTVEAAGIANVFSAGNNGPGPLTIGVPAQVIYDSLNVFCVGALDASNVLAGFSSNGPSRCSSDSMIQIKPEVSAPGVNVRSADGPTGYGQKSGTSMASPHVTGAVLLLKEAFPQLSGRQILNALYQTALDLGPFGEDNLYGRGIIRADAAYQFLATLHTPTPPSDHGPDLAILGLDSPVSSGLGLRCASNSPLFSNLKFRIANLGDTVVNGFMLDVYDNQSWHHSVSFGGRTLAPAQISDVTIGSLNRNLFNAQERWMFRISPIRPPGAGMSLQGMEGDTLNNYFFLQFRNIRPANDLITEHFNDSIRLPFVIENHRVADWTIENPDNDDYTSSTLPATWSYFPLPSTPSPFHTTSAGANGIGTGWAAGIKMREYSARLRQKDHLVSPPFFLQGAPAGQHYKLYFDAAYSNRNNAFRDSLIVSFSSDCGYTYQEIYRNGGDSLRSHSGINPADSLAFRRIEVDHPLLQRTTPGSYRLRFTSQNDFGGNLYLTNIGLFRFFAVNLPGADPKNSDQTWSVFPNPSSEQHLNLQIPVTSAMARLHITNHLGQSIWHSAWIGSFDPSDSQLTQTMATFPLDIPELMPGLYLLTLETKSNPTLQRSAKQHQTLRWIKVPR